MSVIHMDGFGHYVTGTNVIQDNWNSVNVDPRFQMGPGTSLARSTSPLLPRSEGAEILPHNSSWGMSTYALPTPASAATMGIGYYFALPYLPPSNYCPPGFGQSPSACILPVVTPSARVGIYLNGGVVATGTTTVVPSTLYHLEMKVTRHASTGTVEIRLNGNLECSYTGNTSTFNPNWLVIAYKTSSFGVVFSDLYVWEDDGLANSDWLGERLVHTLNPDSDVSNDWA